VVVVRTRIMRIVWSIGEQSMDSYCWQVCNVPECMGDEPFPRLWARALLFPSDSLGRRLYGYCRPPARSLEYVVRY